MDADGTSRDFGSWLTMLAVASGLVAGIGAVVYELDNAARFSGSTLWLGLEYRYLPLFALAAQAGAAVLFAALLASWGTRRWGRSRLGPVLGAAALAVTVYLWGCRGLTVELHDLLFGRPAWRFAAGTVGSTLAVAGLSLLAGLLAWQMVGVFPRLWRFRLGRVVIMTAIILPFAVAAAAVLAPQLRPVSVPARNVVLVSMDTLRADHLGCYGYQRSTSPAIDRLAGEGVLFEQAVTQAPWTLPAHMSLFTGLYPATHGLTEFSMNRRRWRRLADEVPLLAELLAARGYVTAAFTGGGFVSPAFGFGRGFDRYATFGRRLEASHAAVRRWLRRHRDGSFFLFLHFYDCHRPYQPPAPFNQRFAAHAQQVDPRFIQRFCQDAEAARTVPPAERIFDVVSQYDGAIAHADHLLGELFDDLERLRLAEQTLVVFFSDHGDEFFEHGNCDHIKSVYDPLVRVPVILRGPGLPRGERRSEAIELRELGQLILDFTDSGVTLGTPQRPLWAALRGRVEISGDGVALSETRYRGYSIEDGVWRHVPWAETGEGLVAARAPSVKLITDEAGTPRELYDLGADPGEQHNLLGHAAAARTPVHDHAARYLHEWLAKRRGQGPRAPVASGELDAATIDELRALGYVGAE